MKAHAAAIFVEFVAEFTSRLSRCRVRRSLGLAAATMWLVAHFGGSTRYSRGMNLYNATIPLFTKFLGAVSGWLDKLEADATARKYAPGVILNYHMAPDQYSFLKQIQAACDTAKFAVAKMAGKDAPAHADTEVTVADLRARLATVITYLNTFTPADFVGCEERSCTHVWMGGKTLRAGDYLDHFVLPNFHFHMSTAYTILRHNGLHVGKMDYLVSLPFQN